MSPKLCEGGTMPCYVTAASLRGGTPTCAGLLCPAKCPDTEVRCPACGGETVLSILDETYTPRRVCFQHCEQDHAVVGAPRPPCASCGATLFLAQTRTGKLTHLFCQKGHTQPLPPVPEAELAAFRRLLWLRHGCPSSALYGDDGEMQCANCLIDFRRASAADIEQRWTHLANLMLQRIATASAVPVHLPCVDCGKGPGEACAARRDHR